MVIRLTKLKDTDTRDQQLRVLQKLISVIKIIIIIV